jgi:single-strand DNA-binding protein
VISFSLATNEREKQGDEWVTATEWHTVVVYGKLAELINDRAQVGDRMLIDGKMKLRKWTDKTGVEKQRTEVIGFNVEFIDGRKSQDTQTDHNTQETPF